MNRQEAHDKLAQDEMKEGIYDITGKCGGCGKPITSCELCEECAKLNDPWFVSKYRGDYCP
jgi:hypothetical protein